MTSDSGFDVVIVVGLCGTALAAVAAPRFFRSAVLFMVLGVLAALAWARLGAIDLALAEVALGAGVTGALFIVHAHSMPAETASRPPPRWLFISVPLAGLAAAAVGALLLSTERVAGSGALVLATLSDTGVKNPMTGVLMSFRGYDTLLETAAILIALVCVGTGRSQQIRFRPSDQSVLVRDSARWLGSAAVLVAAMLLWNGAAKFGGAFQAAAALTGVMILLAIGGSPVRSPIATSGRRTILCLGVWAFVAVGLLGLGTDGSFLGFRGSTSTIAIFVIETAACVSIAGALYALFGLAWQDRSRRER